jgi:NADH-quinone oxidoreductase subunit L
VFLVCRMSPLFEYAPHAKMFVVYIGALTAFFAATVGLVQNDIKRVIAYSTCSQLGYMFVAAGVGVYSVAMFHLLTHAFFKAMLFLGAGSVIHAMHHEQDMRNYGGLRHKIPYTFYAMLIGTLAITGVGIPLTSIGFAGFLSKDAIIESAWAGGPAIAFIALVVAAMFTSFYSWRLMFMTFFGHPHDKEHYDHAHESPMTMLIPLGVLAVGSVLAGMVWYGVFFGDHAKVTRFFGMAEHHAEATEGGHAGEGDHAESVAEPDPVDTGAEATEQGEAADMTAPTTDAAPAEAHAEAAPAEGGAHAAAPAVAPEGAIFMAPDSTVLDDAHHAPVWVKLSPFVAMLIGLGTAWLFYIRRPDLPGRLAAQQRPLYLFLLNKWYVDEIYDAVFVRPTKALGRFLWKRGDGATIDGTINGVALGIVPFLTRLAGRAQSGYVYHYAFAMVLGIVVLVTWMTLAGGN